MNGNGGDSPQTDPSSYQFSGHYQHAIDAKGRVSIPAKLRQQVRERAEAEGRQEAYFLLKGADGALVLLPEDRWERLNRALFSQGPNDPRMRFRRREAQSMSFPVSPDKQGRIAIPGPLAELAGLSKEALFLGYGPYVEVWDPDTYERYCREKEITYSWEEMWQDMYEVLAGSADGHDGRGGGGEDACPGAGGGSDSPAGPTGSGPVG
jgi:MraZ protein